MVKRPAEILGVPTDDTKKIHKRLIECGGDDTCPFTHLQCDKKKHNVTTERDRRIQALGICSVWYGGVPHITCSNRFKGGEIIQYCAEKIFGFDNFVPLGEVPLRYKDANGNSVSLGNFDYILVNYNHQQQKIVDFGIIEFVSFDTTATRGLNEAINDLIEGGMKQDYDYGINLLHTAKLMITQVIIKAHSVQHWQKKMVWVIQDPLYDHMNKLFEFKGQTGVAKNAPIIVLSVKMARENIKLPWHLTTDRVISFPNVASFKQSLSSPVVSQPEFEKAIVHKMKQLGHLKA